MILRNYIQISQKKEQKKCLMGMWVFSAKAQNVGITAYTLENYSNFKNKFLFNNGSILEMIIMISNKSRGNVTFTELSEKYSIKSRFCWYG